MTKNEKLGNTIGYYLLFISLGFSLGITGPALPSLAEQTGSTLGAIGASQRRHGWRVDHARVR